MRGMDRCESNHRYLSVDLFPGEGSKRSDQIVHYC